MNAPSTKDILENCVESGKVMVSLIQRRYQVSYASAVQLKEIVEKGRVNGEEVNNLL